MVITEDRWQWHLTSLTAEGVVCGKKGVRSHPGLHVLFQTHFHVQPGALPGAASITWGPGGTSELAGLAGDESRKFWDTPCPALKLTGTVPQVSPGRQSQGQLDHGGAAP